MGGQVQRKRTEYFSREERVEAELIAKDTRINDLEQALRELQLLPIAYIKIKLFSVYFRIHAICLFEASKGPSGK